MSVYKEIIEWSTALPLWQRDALRRLATTGPLSQDDLAVLCGLCIAEANRSQMGRPAIPITLDHVPASRNQGPVTTLSEISENRSVNALMDNQRLSFAATGLTSVYGDNGAGKSGYVRVLRHVCHARGVTPAVHPNLYADQPGTPSARITYQVDGTARQVAWQPGIDSSKDLARIAVFDSQAASELTEKDNAVLWTPGGLDLLEGLVSAVDAVRLSLSQHANTLATPVRLPETPPGTSAARFVENLTGTTSPQSLDQMRLTPEEGLELQNLDQALATPDPNAAATNIRQKALRFRSLRGRLGQLEEALGAAHMQRLKHLRDSYDAAALAEGLLAEQTFGDSLIQGVGQAAWQTLWNAAEAFARSGATPDSKFPSDIQPSYCLLCQQPIPGSAGARLQRFHTFVRSDIAKQRSNASQALADHLSRIGAIRIQESTDSAIIQELSTVEPEHAPNFALAFEMARTTWNAIRQLRPDAGLWHLPEPIAPGWSDWLEGVAGRLDLQALALEQLAKPEDRRAQCFRRDELRGRKALCDGKDILLSEISRRAHFSALQRSIQSCVTTGITRQAGELTRTYVSKKLMDTFQAEARALRLPVTVGYTPSKNDKGTSYQRVVLETAKWAGGDGKPAQVLSEGERRATALAAFIAEVETSGATSGIVLDDPVSSLDHERRRSVATRLADLAQRMQVIVFTHDLVFLHMLREATKRLGTKMADREVLRAGLAPGYCREKPPIKAMPIKALVGELKDIQQKCAVQFLAGDMQTFEASLKYGYGLLREAWERSVEDVLFNQAVMRFDNCVHTKRLKPVHDIRKEDIEAIDDGMTICSSWLPGHAESAAINEATPHPQDLLREIKRLEDFINTIRTRRN